MTSIPSLAALLESFFTQRLMKQRSASSHTISSYRDTFRLLLRFAQQRLGKPPSRLALEEIDAPLIVAFLDEMEKSRGISPRSRNLRLTAIRSFFHYAALEAPAQSAQIQPVLAIPGKRHIRTLVHFLTRPEAAPPKSDKSSPGSKWKSNAEAIAFVLSDTDSSLGRKWNNPATAARGCAALPAACFFFDFGKGMEASMAVGSGEGGGLVSANARNSIGPSFIGQLTWKYLCLGVIFKSRQPVDHTRRANTRFQRALHRPVEKPGGRMFAGEVNATFRRRKMRKEALAITRTQKSVVTSTVRLLVPGDGKHRFRMPDYVRKYLARLLHRECAALCSSESRKRACMWTHDVALQNAARTRLANCRFPEIGRRQVCRSRTRKALINPEALLALDVGAGQ